MTNMETDQTALPVVVIGAGPVGLAAAAHLANAGESFLVLEAGTEVGAAMRQWAHVRVFSPWRHDIDDVAAVMLAKTGWQLTDGDAYPTGGDLIDHYLAPLAALPQIAPHLRVNTRVVSVSRAGFDKVKTPDREHAPFLLIVSTPTGEERILARAVIDASGTWATPNPLGSGGVPAIGETSFARQLFYGIPDVLGRDRERYAGKRVLVVGSGHSAFNALIDLVKLSRETPGATISWAVRRAPTPHMYGGEHNDALPARGSIGTQVRQEVERGDIRLETGFKIQRLSELNSRLMVESQDGRIIGPFDEIVVTTGFRPQLAMLSELRLSLDPALESPSALAPLIDPNVHSCGTVPPHGAEELRHPEADLYIVGMKSYGRAPTFLMLTGYEQVRSVVAAIRGDWDAARRVKLILPESGVCSLDTEGPSEAAACCDIAPTAEVSCCTPLHTDGDHCCVESRELALAGVGSDGAAQCCG